MRNGFRFITILILLSIISCHYKSITTSNEEMNKRKSLSHDGWQISIYRDDDILCMGNPDINFSYPICDGDSVTWYRATNKKQLQDLYKDNPQIERLQYWPFSRNEECCSTIRLPSVLNKFKNLKALHLSVHDTLENIGLIEDLDKLEELDLWLSRTEEIHLDFAKFSKLRKLHFKADMSSEFPQSIFKLENLEYLNIGRFYGIQKTKLDGLCNLGNLVDLRVMSPNFVLPEKKHCLKKLKALTIGANDIEILPNSVEINNLIYFSLREGDFDFRNQFDFQSIEYAYLHNNDYLQQIEFGEKFKLLTLRVVKEDSLKLKSEDLLNLGAMNLIEAKPLLNFPNLKNSRLKSFRTIYSKENLIETIGKENLAEYIINNDH